MIVESDGKPPDDDDPAKRRENGRFGEGNQAAKGHGRPALSEDYKRAIRQLEPKALRALDEILADEKHPQRRKAAEYVIDRRRGRPRVRAEITGAKGQPLVPPVESAVLQALRKLIPPGAAAATDPPPPADPPKPEGE
jgi:hypothetical protein